MVIHKRLFVPLMEQTGDEFFKKGFAITVPTKARNTKMYNCVDFFTGSRKLSFPTLRLRLSHFLLRLTL